jgi:hypothetical protein
MAVKVAEEVQTLRERATVLLCTYIACLQQGRGKCEKM